MKKLIALLCVLFVAVSVFAQTSSLADPDPSVVGADSAAQALREISLDLFEREGAWNCRISPDVGVISGRLFDGGPYSNLDADARQEQIKLPEEVATAENDTVYGVKVEFFRRGINTFYISAARPIPIEGVTKTVSVWFAGRNQSHKVTLLVQDYFGNNFEVYMGTLDFSGWKKLTVAIPPSPDGKRGIVQQSAFWGDRPGLRIVGFRIDCDPEYAYGQYYLYMDDLRAVTDLYDMENSDPDDISDNW